jgi:hypothetical protein
MAAKRRAVESAGSRGRKELPFDNLNTWTWFYKTPIQPLAPEGTSM